MAEDQQDQSQKTEEPTQKKLDDARKKGQGVTSREINHWFILMAAAILVTAFLPGVMGDIARALRPFIERPHTMHVGLAESQAGIGNLMLHVGSAVVIPVLLFIVAAFGAGFVQRGFSISAESIKPNLEKISPLKGAKRLFSLRSLMEFTKGVVKIVIVAAVGALTVLPELRNIELYSSMSILQLLDLLHSLVTRLLIGVCAVMTVIAGLDFFYQRFEFMKQMRMSRQEIRDEHKQSEGDPMIRARIRQLRQERARHRMIAAVPEADVVITNPTHYAVALKYDTATMSAPKCVAKGADRTAQRIREVAEEHEVTIVENPPLARSLFSSVDVDEEIPVAHYKAVAEIIGYVWRLKGKMRQNSGDTRP